MKSGTDRGASAEAIFRRERLPPIVLSPRRHRFPWCLALPMFLIAVLAAASHALWHIRSVQPRSTASGGSSPPEVANPPRPVAPVPAKSTEPTAFPPFPKNGTAVVNLPRGIARLAGVTIETGAGGAHWVVTLRLWASGSWIATLYLEADSVTTLFLPAGTYQVAAAAGDLWQGDTRLFGDDTRALRFQGPVRLGPGQSNHRLIMLPPPDASPPAAVAIPSFVIRTR